MSEYKRIYSEYNSWSSEDLKSLYKDLLKERDTCELYSDRADLNQKALVIAAELQRRNDYVERKSN